MTKPMEWKATTYPVEYQDALSFMDSRVAAIHKGAAQECVWLLEHPPLYTGGTSAKAGDLLDARFPVFKTGRGGEYTYHGPGQRVGYVMLNLRKRQKQPDIKAYVHDLERWIIMALASFGITGERREGRVGIWVETDEGDKKIAALGVRIRRWVSLHGISINVSPDLSHFSGIIPCGISDAGVTSMCELLGRDVEMAEFDAALKDKFQDVFNRR